MRASNYTLRVEVGPGRYLLFSTLWKTVVQLDRERVALWDEGRVEEVFSHPELEPLRRRFLVEDDASEFPRAYHQLLHPLGAPRTLFATVVVTMQCNMACAYCHESGQRGPARMSAETAQRVGRFLRERAAEGRYERLVLYFYGGEPLLNIDAMEAVCRAIAEGGVPFEVRFPTNGTLLDGDRMARLRALSAEVRIQVSLDGPRPVQEGRRRLTTSQGQSYERVLRAIEEAAGRFEVTIRTNVDRSNAGTVGALLSDLVGRGILPHRVRWYAAPIAPVIGGAPEVNALVLSPAEWEEVAPRIWQEQKAHGIPLDHPEIGSGMCGIPQRSVITIDCDGGMHPCTGLHSRTEARGSVEEGSVPWSTRTPDQFPEQCKRCAYFPYCGGGCSAIDGAPAEEGHCPFDHLSRMVSRYLEHRHG